MSDPLTDVASSLLSEYMGVRSSEMISFARCRESFRGFAIGSDCLSSGTGDTSVVDSIDGFSSTKGTVAETEFPPRPTSMLPIEVLMAWGEQEANCSLN